MLNIDQYPELIETTAKALAGINQQIATKNLELSSIEMRTESRIAFDPELKNEPQRKVRRAEILSQTDHTAIKQELIELENQRQYKAAELERQRNEFSLLKLQLRKSIADVEF